MFSPEVGHDRPSPGLFYDAHKSHGHLGSVKSLISVLCDPISSTHEAMKDQ